MSIKLICSDIDGTLLQYGKKELEDEIFEQIRELHRRGILFCVSGCLTLPAAPQYRAAAVPCTARCS